MRLPLRVIAAAALFASSARAGPREMMIPGTPMPPGTLHLMANAFAYAGNQGVDGYRIDNGTGRRFDGGETVPLLTHDWIMGYARDRSGVFETSLMLDLEAFTNGPGGIPELGQYGEGLWDAQHAHQLFHEAMLAVHPVTTDTLDLSIFAGQGSATIGPPIFMHRGSSPGPSVPRKHHKGENPHETSPVIGTYLRVKDTVFEMSVFGAKELGPGDSKFHPHPSTPASLAARVRQIVDDHVELQISGERLRDQGAGIPNEWQGSASAYAWCSCSGWQFDALLDGAFAVHGALAPSNDATPSAHAGHGGTPGSGDRGIGVTTLGLAQRDVTWGGLFELAARTPSRGETFWLRSEINERFEPPTRASGVSTPWFFETAGAEHVVGRPGGLAVGLFLEATWTRIPSSVAPFYGRSDAASVNAGVHLSGMWMPGHHGHHHGM